MTMGKVLYLPTPARTCNKCTHFEMVETGEELLCTWCGEWDDEIDNVDQAGLCTDFVRADEPPTGQHSQSNQGAP